MADRIARAQVVLTIGAEPGVGESELISPSAVFLGEDGRTIVLDDLRALHVYDPDGLYLGAAELPPLRWSPHPAILRTSTEGFMLVKDDALVELAGATGGYATLGEFKLNEAANSSCILGEAIVTQVGGESSPVRIYNSPPDTQSVAIGRPYESPSASVRSQMSQGVVACDPDGLTIYMAYTMLPWIVALGSDGTEFWRSAIADFRPPVVSEKRDPLGGTEISTSVPQGGSDGLETLVVLDDQFLLAQVASGRDGERMIRSYIIDVVTGEGTFVGTELPIVVAATSNRLASISPGTVKLLEY